MCARACVCAICLAQCKDACLAKRAVSMSFKTTSALFRCSTVLVVRMFSPYFQAMLSRLRVVLVSAHSLKLAGWHAHSGRACLQ